MSRWGPGPARYSREQLAKTGEDVWLSVEERALVLEAVARCSPGLIPDSTTAAMAGYALMAHGSSEASVSIVVRSWMNRRRRAAAAQYCAATGEDRQAMARELGLGWIPLRPAPVGD